MKLHLHWLRFDLHRFRLLLGVWTLLVAAYAVFLGWVHLRFLTIRPEIMDRSLYIAILLGLVELCFLFALFNADPARGRAISGKPGRPPARRWPVQNWCWRSCSSWRCRCWPGGR